MKTDNNIQTFEQCLKCNICADVCPMMAVNPAYPGPKQSGPDGERYRLKSPVFVDKALKYCLNCKRCEVACPSDVPVGDIIQAARLASAPKVPKIRDWALASTDFVGSVASSMSPLVNKVLGLGFTRKTMDALFSIDCHRIFPKYAGERFEKWFEREAAPAQEQFGRKVNYFHGCYANYNYPKLAQDLVKILNAAGCGVRLLKDEKCCGVALISNGLKEKATAQARTNIDAMRAVEGPVLTTSSTCTMTMRDEYPHLLDVDNADVRDRIMLATRFLHQEVEQGRMKLAFRPEYKRRVAYHTACHMSRLGWQYFSVSMLRMIPGVELVELEQNCCGIAGTFGFKEENYGFSQMIGEKLFATIRDAAPDLVATDCETCKWQIEMSTGFKVENPISILADALDVVQTQKLNNAIK